MYQAALVKKEQLTSEMKARYKTLLREQIKAYIRVKSYDKLSPGMRSKLKLDKEPRPVLLPPEPIEPMTIRSLGGVKPCNPKVSARTK
jgi:hypothetical protein